MSKMARRLRNAAVIEKSESRLLKKSPRGVWLFAQSDTLEGGRVRKSYLVYDARTKVPGGFRTVSYQEALDEFRRRMEELPTLAKSA
jgi:hypothetical protein